MLISINSILLYYNVKWTLWGIEKVFYFCPELKAPLLCDFVSVYLTLPIVVRSPLGNSLIKCGMEVKNNNNKKKATFTHVCVKVE